MAREKWFHKLISQFNLNAQPESKSSSNPKLISSIIYHRSSSFSSSSSVGILSFEVAGMASKLIALYSSLSDKSIIRLKNECISLDGVRKIVSNDDDFLLALACAEMLHSLRHIAISVATYLSHRCRDHNLRSFLEAFDDFAETGRDPHNWILTTAKELETLTKKLDRQITATALLYRETEELSHLENSPHCKSKPESANAFSSSFLLIPESDHLNYNNNNNNNNNNNHNTLVEAHLQKIVWQKQEVKTAKDKSLWTRSFDSVTMSLARLIFTVLSRIKLVFGLAHSHSHAHDRFVLAPATLPRSFSAKSSAVFPSHDLAIPGVGDFESSQLRRSKTLHVNNDKDGVRTTDHFFQSNTKVLSPPPGTLGASALALHYANLIIVLDKMVKSPQLIGLDARDDLYSMLPNSIRWSLRSRLKGVGFTATTPGLAREWRDAMGRILGWLGPLAHNMIKWQSERSFEQNNQTRSQQHLRGNKPNFVFLLQTLYFAKTDKTEAAITELLVGLNYIWRFEREMNARALFDSSNFFHMQPSRHS